jgi:hypothetical protein
LNVVENRSHVAPFAGCGFHVHIQHVTATLSTPQRYRLNLDLWLVRMRPRGAALHVTSVARVMDERATPKVL